MADRAIAITQTAQWLEADAIAAAERISKSGIVKKFDRLLADANGTRTLYERRVRSVRGGGSGGGIREWNVTAIQRDFPGTLKGNYSSSLGAPAQNSEVRTQNSENSEVVVNENRLAIRPAPGNAGPRLAHTRNEESGATPALAEAQGLVQQPQATSLCYERVGQLSLLAPPPPAGVLQGEWEVALERWKLIEPLINGDWKRTSFPGKDSYVAWVAKNKGICKATLYLWRSKALEIDLATGLERGPLALVKKVRSDKGSSVKPLLEQHKEELRANWNRGFTARACWRELRRACKAQGASEEAIPSYRACRKFLSNLPIGHRVRGVMGRQEFENEHLPILRLKHDDIPPMGLAVLDHTQLDIAVDYLGRACFPWLTLFLDWHSRYPLGFWLAETPSSYTVAMAARMMFIFFGSPRRVLTDQGRDIRGKYISGDGFERRHKFRTPNWSTSSKEQEATTIRGVFQSAGMEDPWFAKGRHPQTKGVIERFFGTINRDFSRHLFHAFYRGGNTRERGYMVDPLIAAHNARASKGLSSPLPAIQDVGSHLFNWFFEDYANREHEGQGMRGRTPAEAFRPKPPLAGPQVDLLLMKRELRDVRNCAVQILGHFYASDELFAHNGHNGAEVAYDPHGLVFPDLANVIVTCCGQSIRAACTQPLSVTGVDRLEVQKRIAARNRLRKAQEEIAQAADDAAPFALSRRPHPVDAMRTQPKTDVPATAMATPHGIVPVAPADPRYKRPGPQMPAAPRLSRNFACETTEEDADLLAALESEDGGAE